MGDPLICGGRSGKGGAIIHRAAALRGLSRTEFAYDPNGNASSRNGYSITWASYNYPTAINANNKSVALYYDANRQRYKQVYSNGSTIETTIYAGGLLEKVTLGSIVDWRHYIRAGNELVAIMSRQSSGTNVTHYVLGDHEGSIAKITDGSGASTVAESFSAFGTRRDPSTWSGLPSCPDLGTIKSISREGYTGQDAIGGVSMGLNHMNGRVQDALTGRFLSADPFIPNGGSTQSYNRYSYVNNNPLTLIDPSGFVAEYKYETWPAGSSDNSLEPIVVTAEKLYTVSQSSPSQDVYDILGPRGGSAPDVTEGFPETTVLGHRTSRVTTNFTFEQLLKLNFNSNIDNVLRQLAQSQTPKSNTPCHTYLLGGGGSAVGGVGGEASSGGYLSAQDGSIADFGGFLSEGAGAGVNVSGDVFFGFFNGGASAMRGDSDNINASLGPISVTLIFAPSNGPAFSGRLMGGTIGAGPGLPGGLSGTKSMTQVGSLAKLFGMSGSCGP